MDADSVAGVTVEFSGAAVGAGVVTVAAAGGLPQAVRPTRHTNARIGPIRIAMTSSFLPLRERSIPRPADCTCPSTVKQIAFLATRSHSGPGHP
jgi:hypothetical protein